MDSAFRCRHCNLILTLRDIREIMREAPWLAEGAPDRARVHWTENVSSFERDDATADHEAPAAREPRVRREAIPPTVDRTDVLAALMIAEAMMDEDDDADAAESRSAAVIG
jgi:hypothetical protein